jgi:hypothetical protein
MSKENMEKLNKLISNISDKYNEYENILQNTLGQLKVIRPKIKPILKELEKAKLDLVDYLNNRLKTIESINEFSIEEIMNLLYPLPDDEFFNLKLNNHLIMKQYEDTQNVKELVEKLYSVYSSSKDKPIIKDLNSNLFILQSFQKILKNYIGTKSIYNGILVIHGTGVGKTCTGITMAEGLKDFVELSKKKIHILRADEFQRQIFVINKVKNGEPQIQCTGRTYVDIVEKEEKFKEALIRCQQGFDDECKIFEKGVKKELKKYYNFTTYRKWASSLARSISTKTRSLDDLAAHQKKIEIIRKEFNNSVLIIDEAHNLRNERLDDETGFNVTSLLEQVLLYSQNMKVILLSATPMYNEPADILQLLNYLLINDNRPRLERKDIFKESNITDKGEKTLRKYSTGYISYIRGNDPIKFPLRLDADVNMPDKIIKKYPSYSIINKKLADDEKLKYLKIIGCELQSIQEEIIGKLLDSKKDLNLIEEVSNNILDYENTLDFEKLKINKLNNEKNSGKSSKLLSLKSSKTSMKSNFDSIKDYSSLLSKNIRTKLTSLNKNEINDMNELALDDMDDIQLSVALSRELQISTFVYQSLKEASDDINFTYGASGFSSIFQKSQKGNTYQFRDEDYAKNYMGESLKNYGCKIYECLKSIEKSNGPVFVYGKYVYGSILPMAIALELAGYSRFDGLKPLIDNKHKKPANGFEYIIYTGRNDLTTSKEKKFFDLRQEMIKRPEVKVILASDKGSEGLNLFGFRELHILDPWHNINLLEQTIGRVIRTYSHEHLPPAHRNATIHMHSTIFSNSSKYKKYETYDLHTYSLCERKAIGSSRVENILRNNAIDCLLNKPWNQRRKEDYNKKFEIITSHDKKINYNFYDKPFSKNTLYLKDSEYMCYVEEKNKPQLFKKISKVSQDLNKILNRDLYFYNLELRELIEKIINEITANMNLQYEDLIRIVKSATLNIKSSFGIENINSILEYIINYFKNNNIVIMINKKEHYITSTKVNGKYLLRLLAVDNYNPKLAIANQKNILKKHEHKLELIKKHEKLLKPSTYELGHVDKIDVNPLISMLFKQKHKQISKTELNYKSIILKIKKSVNKIIFEDELENNNGLDNLNNSNDVINKIEFKTNLNLSLDNFINEIYQVIFDRLLPIEKKFLLQNLVKKIKHKRKLSKLERILINLIRYNFVNVDEVVKTDITVNRSAKFIYYEDYIAHPEKLYGFLYYDTDNLKLYKYTKYKSDDENNNTYDIKNFFVEDKIKLNTLTTYRWRIMENQTPNLLFGFINYVSKTQIAKFKIMDYLEHGTFVKSVKGFECLSKLSNDLFKYISKIEPNYKDYIKENQKNKKYLCGNLELLLRYNTNKDGDMTNPFIKRFFFTPEEYAIYQMYNEIV